MTGKGGVDSRQLEIIFAKCRDDKEKMRKLVRAFCNAYLIDNKQRPLRLRPLQEDIVLECLINRTDGKQKKLAILAPRGSGKSFALSVAVTIYMFFNRFRDLVFILAPTEDQAALIFNYVYRHFADNTFLNGLVANYRFHNKPNITLKGGTIMRRAPLAPSNQGQAIRGQHPTFLVVDESPLIDDKLFIDNVEPAIVSNKAPFINLGTPKSKDNHMWRYLYDDNYADTFTRLHYTWRDAVKKGEAYSAPYTEEEMLDKMMEWGEESIYWRTEYECEFVESVANIFSPEKIKRCYDDYELIRLDGDGFKRGGNITVGVDIGKSVNSTVISAWSLDKSDTENIARLVYLEEINARTGGHDIPYQRQRIMDVTNELGASRLIVDCTGIGGAVEQDLRLACLDSGVHFVPFVFTGGPKGTKTQMYRDFVSYIQQNRVKVPNPENLEPDMAKLIHKWTKEHIELEYTMDAANKTEKIAAPSGKHDDYCDSSAMGIHATLSMLPMSGNFGQSIVSRPINKNMPNRGNHSNSPLFTTSRRKVTLNKQSLRGL
tara:strand:- start:1210 stop:2844 length:1635 start_codon:yes stop_codon:yes gene_type:complete